MKNQVQTASFQEVLRYYAKGWKPRSGEEIASVRWYVDPGREVFVFDILVREKGDAAGVDSQLGGFGFSAGVSYAGGPGDIIER